MKQYAFTSKNNIELQIVNHCNLNCKSCSHFAPLADKWFLDPDQLEHSLSQIPSSTLNFFDSFHILGGEPLLHPDLIKIIQIVRKYYIKDIQILTNGILLTSMSKELFKECRKNKIQFFISLYKNVDSKKIENFVYNNGINANVYKNNTHDLTFVRNKIDISGSQNIHESFINCYYGDFSEKCLQLVDTKLYYCAMCAYIDIFNKKAKTNIKCDEYLDLTNTSIYDIYDFINNTQLKFCAYCNNEEMIDCQPSNKTIDEWL